MSKHYLEVTFQQGRPFAAYYHLVLHPDVTSARCRRVEPSMVVDYAADGRALGIEITTPAKLTLEDFNHVLGELGLPPVTDEELAPLHAA